MKPQHLRSLDRVLVFLSIILSTLLLLAPLYPKARVYAEDVSVQAASTPAAQQANTVQFTDTSSSGSESVSPVNIGVSLDFPAISEVTVTYAATGGTASAEVDYSFTAPVSNDVSDGRNIFVSGGVATIAEGESTTDIVLYVIDDTTVEDDETVVITLTEPSGALLGENDTYTYTILDNDATDWTIEKTATPETVEAGADVGIGIAISNASEDPDYLTMVTDVIPTGFTYKGSCQLTMPDDSVETCSPEIDGENLTWTFPEGGSGSIYLDPGESVNISYLLEASITEGSFEESACIVTPFNICDAAGTTVNVVSAEEPDLPETGSNVLGLIGAVALGLLCMLSYVVVRVAKRSR